MARPGAGPPSEREVEDIVRPSDASGYGHGKILVIDRHLMIAESLAFCLNLEGFEVDLAVPTPDGRLEGIQPRSWDVVILNIDLETQDDIQHVVPLLSEHGPVVALIARTNRLRQAWCLEAGAVALADKEQPVRTLVELVYRVLDGEKTIASGERDALLELGRRHSNEVLRRRAPFLDLTEREQVVLSHLLDGQPVRTIARLAGVTEATVRSHIRSIFRKLGVNSQLRAVSLARQVGWSATGPRKDVRTRR
jgi:two-component system, NarL family, nitrate/nitrite response regulator NarL